MTSSSVDVVLRRGAARRPDDEGLRHLVAALVVDADHRGVRGVGRGEQHGLQLGRGHLVALVLDQPLDPVDDEPPAVLVDRADVAGVQPAVGVDERVGLLLAAEVALHALRPADPDRPPR
jgi:hypothetical protein